MKSERTKMPLQEGLDGMSEAILKLDGRLKVVERWMPDLVQHFNEAMRQETKSNTATDKYILDENGEPQPEPDLLKWAAWVETADRAVAKTQIAESEISTVFLGLDHSFGESGAPILYETMVFGGALDGEQERYETREQAKKGHEAIVLRVQEATPQQTEGQSDGE